MDLEIDGQTLQVDVLDRTTFISRHTGRELRRLSATLDVLGEGEQAHAQSLVRAGQKHGAIGDDGGGIRRWRLTERSFGFQETAEPVLYSFRFELEEDEPLMPSRLRVGGLTLR